jgi:hypothetical protein
MARTVIEQKERKVIKASAEGSYKGNPTVTIPKWSKGLQADEGVEFTMGVEKAHAVLRHIEAIKAFAAKHKSGLDSLAGGVDAKTAAASLSVDELKALLAERGAL